MNLTSIPSIRVSAEGVATTSYPNADSSRLLASINSLLQFPDADEVQYARFRIVHDATEGSITYVPATAVLTMDNGVSAVSPANSAGTALYHSDGEPFNPLARVYAVVLRLLLEDGPAIAADTVTATASLNNLSGTLAYIGGPIGSGDLAVPFASAGGVSTANLALELTFDPAAANTVLLCDMLIIGEES